MPVDAFVETINHWNEMCAAGADTDFDMPGTMMMTIDQPPFYATKEYADGLCTAGGLIVDTECRVLDQGSPAHRRACSPAGITSGGMFYNTYPHNLNCLSPHAQLPDGLHCRPGARRQGVAPHPHLFR